MALSLLLLDAYPSDLPPYHIRTVGGTSSARWMAKVVIEMKLVMFRSQFVSCGLMTTAEASEHTLLVDFLLKYYVQRWLQCPGAEDAAVIDLELFHALSNIKPGSPEDRFAAPMLRKFDQHLWYLSEELAVFCFFSSMLSHSQKALCAKSMKRYHRKGDLVTPDGKMTTPILKSSTRVWHLFGPKSWLIFKLIGFDETKKSFLDKPVKDWANDAEYQYLQGVVANLQVVNDPAERGVLLGKTLQGRITYDQEERKKLFLSIPHVREKLKRLTRSALINFNI